MSARALEELERALSDPDDADDVLRETVRILVEEPSVTYAAIAFTEESALVVGPQAGTPSPDDRRAVTVTFQNATVGELWVDGEADIGFLERVADLVAAHVLLGWDTGGEAWEP